MQRIFSTSDSVNEALDCSLVCMFSYMLTRWTGFVGRAGIVGGRVEAFSACARSLVVYTSPAHSPWPPHCHRQPAVTVGSRRCGLSKRIYYQLRQRYGRLSGHYLKIRVRHGPGVRLLSHGLLQLSVLQHLGTDEPVTVGSELHRQSGYSYSTFRPHITRVLCEYTGYRHASIYRLQGCHARPDPDPNPNPDPNPIPIYPFLPRDAL